MAYYLTSANYADSKPGVREPESAARYTKKAFELYRSTSHLQAMWVLEGGDLSEAAFSRPALLRFLGQARAISDFVTDKFRGGPQVWDPIGIPDVIDPFTKIEVPRLLIVTEN